MDSNTGHGVQVASLVAIGQRNPHRFLSFVAKKVVLHGAYGMSELFFLLRGETVENLLQRGLAQGVLPDTQSLAFVLLDSSCLFVVEAHAKDGPNRCRTCSLGRGSAYRVTSWGYIRGSFCESMYVCDRDVWANVRTEQRREGQGSNSRQYLLQKDIKVQITRVASRMDGTFLFFNATGKIQSEAEEGGGSRKKLVIAPRMKRMMNVRHFHPPRIFTRFQFPNVGVIRSVLLLLLLR